MAFILKIKKKLIRIIRTIIGREGRGKIEARAKPSRPYL